MGTSRLEAFSDGVLAIIITIMVLEMKVPHDPTFEGLRGLAPVFLSYILSFVYVGIYWNNHHHLLHTCKKVTGRILWANLHLLFWLSLFPFVTGWMGEESALKQAIGKDWKGKVSSVLYLCAIVSTFFALWLAQLIYVAVAALWLVPDRRIEG